MPSHTHNTPALRFPGYIGVWEQQNVGDIATIVGGGTPATTHSEYWNGTIDWYAPAEITNQRYVSHSQRQITQLGLEKSSAQLLPAHKTVLFTSRAGIGKMAILQHEAATNQGFQSLVLHDDIDPYFIYSMNAILKKKAEKIAAGSTFLEISGSHLAHIRITIPSLSEQKQIGSLFHNLDNRIDLHQRQTQKLTELKQGLLQNMFPREGESVPRLRFPGFTTTWKQKQFKDLFTECREKTTVENEDILLSCAINGIFLNKELFSHFRGSTTIGYLKVKKNDLILSAQNLHLGNANVNQCFESGIVSPAYKVFHIIDCDPNFVQTWVKQETTKNFFLACTTEGASTCRKNVDWALLNRSILQVPHINEQRKIGSFFHTLDDLIHLHEQYTVKLTHLKKGLLQKMFPQD